MDENYIDIVRKTLYGNGNEIKVKSTQKMKNKEKKITFDIDKDHRESAYKLDEKQDKITHRKSTPFKKKELRKRKAVTTQNSDSSFEEHSTKKEKNRKITSSKVAPKKKKLIITYSSDSFDEEVKDNLLSPSKSEMELFQNTFDKSKETINLIEDSSSDSEESTSPFDLDDFFNTYEPSLDESITEAHSGIDNEFESEYVRKANIISSKLNNMFSTKKQVAEANDGTMENAEDAIVLSDSETNDVSDDDTERNISAVADKIEDTIVLDDDEEDNSLFVEESPEKSENSYVIEEGPEKSEDDQQWDVEYIDEHTDVNYYNLEDCTIVVLKENQSVSFYGLLRLEVLYGKIEVFGSVLNKTSKVINLYSPKGSALLQLKNVMSEDAEETNIKDILSDLNLNNISITNNCALVKCTRLEDVRIPFIEKYISQQIFPREENNCSLPRVTFSPEGSWNVLKENYVWSEILNNVKPSTKLMLVGGKGVGKSTLLRFAINKLLNRFDKVRVIDLDPGQSEFAIPGCVSVVTVREPVFGPNYTHLQKTDRSLLSNINIGHDPLAYIQCIRSLMSYYNTLDECPTLINYMGFVQRIGLNIVSSAITYIQPTDIIQIQSRHRSKNFIMYLTAEVIQENCKLFTSQSVTLDYNLHNIPAMNDDNTGWSLEPRQCREMCVLAYMGQMMREGVNSLLSHLLPMYEAKLSFVKITNTEREDISPAAVNANLVTLCSLEEETNIFVCLGHGVVRGIDLETETLILVTPEAPSILEEVTHLVLGNVNLPPSVYMTPDDVKGHIPYVMKGEFISLGQITKRTYLPTNKK